MRREDQERLLTELRSRIVAERVERSGRGQESLEEVLAESIYHERRRLKEERDGKLVRADKAFWSAIQSELPRSTEKRRRDMLGEIVSRYGEEICGNFDPRVYDVSTSILPPALGVLLNAVSPRRLLGGQAGFGLESTVVVQGEVEHLRSLQERGTVILCPTHVSNLDSPILGYAIYRMGLPPFVYGAGLNLFTNPMLSFFMHNLGAYTVDRKKRDPLYKDVLKSYAGLTLELGYNNLFFPGGTRARSGAIERRLKLGLLGTSVGAYVQNLKRGANQPRIFIVPATLSFQLVLEAETLIDDFLKEVGKSRYIITDDESAKPRRVWDFVSQLFSLHSKIYVTISRGLDPFGNDVTDEGISLDPRGREVDIARYVMVDGEPRIVPQRDAEYTHEAGLRIAEAFSRDNVIQSTHVTARAVFSLLRKANPDTDLIRLIRVGGKTDDLGMREVYTEVERLKDELVGLAARGGVRLGETVAGEDPTGIVADGLRHFAIYHKQPALKRRGDRIFATDRMLLFYYQNRLEGYRLDRTAGTRPALAEDHLHLGARA
ncbi:MAG: 1-acyl-sn-glycerol-3-phosphate acyltransferase [Deltaproteobacteria bacterium]|nr:1-acyl-sn-glycerol-3-phosphate acyltransferase [Deltaproteobacteria bacterium]